MKRRSFIKTIPLLATSPMILSEERLSKKPEQRHLISLGTAAGSLIEKHGSKMNFDSFTVIDCGAPKGKEVVLNQFWFSAFDSEVNPFSYLRFEKNSRLPIISIPDEIVGHLRQLEGELIFWSGLGNVTGTILTQSLATISLYPTQSLKWIVTTPFTFEGENRKAWATRAISILKENNHVPICFSFENIRSKYGNLSIRSAFEKGDLEVLKLMDIDSATI